MSRVRQFSTASSLQEYLLNQTEADSLILVPHRRLARQLWHRQRLQNRGGRCSAWEPLPVLTLGDWWRELFQQLWPPMAVAPLLVRLALWQQAIRAVPELEGTGPTLSWAWALDEAHQLLCRYGLPLADSQPAPPLVEWRRQVSRVYRQLLREGGWLSPEDLPGYLGEFLADGKIQLPKKVLVVGLDLPAPVEEGWLAAVAGFTDLRRLEIRGDKTAVSRAVVLPERDQETTWALAHLLEAAARQGVPLHRLALTSPDLEAYLSRLRRLLRELLGPPQASGKYAYNFSRGPQLSETPLFQAALLPLVFFCQEERREDLAALLFSPFYRLAGEKLEVVAAWDRLLREQRVEQGWGALRATLAEAGAKLPAASEILGSLDQVSASLPNSPASGREWLAWLCQTWNTLGFPQITDVTESGHYQRIVDLLSEFEVACRRETMYGRQFLEWLKLGATHVILAGPGSEESGLQILGLLETRGLDFDQVVCLGMNSGVFPGPPRTLPLLSPAEKAHVLGGSTESQHRFARVLFDNLLGVAPQITLTRPRLIQEEEQVSTPFWGGDWIPGALPILSQPHPVWLRVPAVLAAFQPSEAEFPSLEGGVVPAVSLPQKLSVSQAQTALLCPCRFLLEVLLGLKELPEVQRGILPRERGEKLHLVLHRFVREFREDLLRSGWQDDAARRLMEEVVQKALAEVGADLDWQAERWRWLGESEASPGLLQEWLAQEKQRYEEGWRWQAAEVAFEGLKVEAAGFTLRGRVDRLDYHPELGFMLWDYKSGALPNKSQVFEDGRELQLPAYLLAARGGLLPQAQPSASLRAGFIGLKSSRLDHLKYEDFGVDNEEWQRLVESYCRRLAEAGGRLAAGDFRPSPTPPPSGKDEGACAYCPFPLVCGYAIEKTSDNEGSEL